MLALPRPDRLCSVSDQQPYSLPPSSPASLAPRSTLPFPCPFHRWSIEALGAGQFRLPPQFTRWGFGVRCLGLLAVCFSHPCWHAARLLLPLPCTPGACPKPHQFSPLVCCRLFRVVPAAVFLRHFASDRSHMWDDEGRWHQPPPPYPCIVAPGGATHTLPRYLDMPPAEGALGDGVAAARALERCSSGGGDGEGGGRWGVVLTQEALLECFENRSGG